MKRINAILIIVLLIIDGCGGGRKSGCESDMYITVDVKANYSKKNLILQDFMDVEYIALETSDEFLCQGRILDIGKEFLLVRNNTNDGDIFVFDRKGKGIRKINRRGQGSEEYVIIFGTVLDEDNNEVFINDVIGRKILTYDLYGKFKRSFQYGEGVRYDDIYSFDNENLICDVGDIGQTNENSFVIISKRDGSIVNKIQIPYKEKKMTVIEDSNGKMPIFYRYFPILPFRDRWILTEASSDSVFQFLPDYSMIPFIVRTPSINSMDPEIFLFPKILTDSYYFMEKVNNDGNKFTKTDLLYDLQKKTLFEYILFNNDYNKKQNVNMITCETKNNKIAFWQKIEAYELVDSYKKGELKGKLRDIAAGLKEGSNPVIMLAKNKDLME